jgi:hypothetical protein
MVESMVDGDGEGDDGGRKSGRWTVDGGKKWVLVNGEW